MGTYSFMDVQASIVGPGGNITMGYGAAHSEEGIMIDMVEDKNKMDIGADGAVQHNLHAGNAATYTFSLLKTSPQNAMLMTMYNLQRMSSALWGKNIIVVNNPVSGDQMNGSLGAFKKIPNIANGKDAAIQAWAFDVGSSVGFLGTGDEASFSNANG